MISAAAKRTLATIIAVACLGCTQASSDPFVVSSPDERNPSQEINNLILGLSTTELGIPYAIRTRMLKGARATNAIGVNEAEQQFQMDFKGEGLSMHLSVTPLNIKSDATKIYLLKITTEIRDCTALRKHISSRDGLNESICYQGQLGQAHIKSSAEPKYGFVAYRFSDGKKAENVTSKIFPPDPIESLLDTERHQAHNELSEDEEPSSQVDLSRLTEVPVLRLYLELSEAGGLPRVHPRAFSGGYPGNRVHTAHLGFLVWNGTQFELKEKVPRALWPCTHDSDFSPSGRSCSPDDPDPFITN